MSDQPRAKGKKGGKSVTVNESATTVASDGCTAGPLPKGSSSSSPESYQRMIALERLVRDGPPESGFLGIVNLGATCYMNSLLQTMFCTPELRDHIVSWEFQPAQMHKGNAAYQLQMLFARMQQTKLRHSVDSTDLINSFGWAEEDRRVQHDVQELNRVLLDTLQQFIDLGNAPQVIKGLYEGSTRDYLQCNECSVRRGGASTFQDVNLVIKGQETLERAFDSLTAPETIDGVTCDNCGKPTETLKGTEFHALPAVLSLTLMRTEFNMETMRREMVDDDIQLPLSLDLAPWVGPEEAAKLKDTPHATQYELHSIIAHRGTAYHGHYFSYVRFDGEGWYKFDDETVSKVTDEDMEEYTNPVEYKRKQAAAAEAAAEARAEAAAKKRAEEGGEPVGDGGPPTEHTHIPMPTDAYDDSGVGEAVAALFDEPVSSTTDTGAGTTTTKIPALTDADEEPVVASLFDDDIGSGPLNLAMFASEGPRKKGKRGFATVSGHAYYAIYRRKTMPAVATTFAAKHPAHVEQTLANEVATLTANRAELEELQKLLHVAVWHNGEKHWVEARKDWTFAQLTDHAWGIVAPQQLRDTVAPEDRTGVFRLREYSPGFKLCGQSYERTTETLQALGCTSMQTFLGTEFRSADEARQPWEVCTKLDYSLKLRKLAQPKDADANTAPYFALVPDEVVVYGHATVGDLRAAVAKLLGGDAGMPPADLTLTIRCSGDPYVLLDDAATCEEAKVGSAEGLFAEPHTDTPRAVEFINAAHMAPVRYNTDLASTEYPDTVQFDLRRTLKELKEYLCEMVVGGLAPEDCQLIMKPMKSERSDLTKTLRMVAGGDTLCFTLLHEAPLREGQFPIDVYTTTGGDPPVELQERITIDETTTCADVAERIFGKDHGKEFRYRMMAPNRKNVYGIPMTKPLVKDSVTSNHRKDELRMVLQEVPPGTPPLDPDALLVFTQRWFPSKEDVAEAGSAPRKEIVLSKRTTLDELKKLLSEDSGLPADEIDFAKCRPFQLRGQQNMYRLSWMQEFAGASESIGQKHVASFPLQLDNEDIIAYRSTAEEWAECAKPKMGVKKGFRKHGAFTALRKDSDGGVDQEKNGEPTSDSGEKKKKRREEVGITIRSNWDEVTPQPEEEGPEEENGLDGGDSAKASAPADASAGEAGSAQPASGDSEAIWQQIPVQEYDSVMASSGLDTECKVCIDDLEVGDAVVVLSCYHIYHKACLARWFEQAMTCPGCSRPVLS